MATKVKKSIKRRRVTETQWAVVLWGNSDGPYFAVAPTGPCVAMTFASREAAMDEIKKAAWPAKATPTPVQVRISEIVPRKKKK